MFKNVASQKIRVFAYDYTTGAPKTGDAAQLTAYVSKDYGSVTVLGDTSATEHDATNAPGSYLFDLTQSETNADCLDFSGKSSTSNIRIVPITIYTFPANFTTFVIDSSGIADADVRQLLGTAWLTPGTAGTPDVNVKLWNALTTVELPLVPTTAGRKLDVSAGGEAGVDWANVGSPTTALALTGTTIAVTQKVDIDTIKTNPVVNGGTITFPTTATLASTTNITAGTVTTATNVTTVNGLAANVITATSINADAITDAKVAADVTIASVTGAVGSVTGAVGSVTGAVGSVTGNVGGNVIGSVASVTATVNADIVKINTDATAAANVAKTTRAICRGTITTGTNSTSFAATGIAPASAVNDQFKGRVVTFDADTTTTALRGQATDITAYTHATATFTVTALTSTPAVGDTFSVT